MANLKAHFSYFLCLYFLHKGTWVCAMQSFSLDN